MSRETVLRQYVDSVKRNYDYVLLDCRPSLGMLVYVQQENFLSFQRKTGPQVVDGRAFANSAPYIAVCFAAGG